MRALRSEGAIAEAHHVAPRVHRLLNTVPRQIQLGSFSNLWSVVRRGLARSVTPVIVGSLDMCRICVKFTRRNPASMI